VSDPLARFSFISSSFLAGILLFIIIWNNN